MENAELYSLAYVSRNAIAEAGGMLSAEIERILQRARDNNRRLGVTGALLYSDGCFAQVLEGPLPAVEAVFERIQCDSRHAEVTVLLFMPIEARNFGGWEMAYVGMPDGAPVDLVATLGAAETSVAGSDLVALLRDMIQRRDAVVE